VYGKYLVGTSLPGLLITPFLIDACLFLRCDHYGCVPTALEHPSLCFECDA
jgi:hypothetical protein